MKKGALCIDISEWQGEIDWDNVSGVKGVMIRAGYGTKQDKYWLRNVSECARLGIPVGAYWFSYATNPDEAEREAEALLSAVADWDMQLPLAFDFEYDSALNMQKAGVSASKAAVSAIVRAFCSATEGARYYTMVYTNKDFSTRYFEDDILKTYDLWLADWKDARGSAKPYRDCGLWQYGTRNVRGFAAPVDANVAQRDFPTIIREAGLNRPAADPVTDFAVKAGLTDDGSDKADTATKYDVWEALYKTEEGGETK